MAKKSELKSIINGLDRIKRELPARVETQVRNAALAIEGHAKQLAPVDTGALRNSIQASKHPNIPMAWQVIVGAEYGAYVEYGTVKAPAQPFLTPAVEAIRPQLVVALEKVIEESATD